MEKNAIIEKAIAEKDITVLRESVASLILIDRNFSKSSFYDMLNYVNSKLNIMDKCGLKGELISELKKEYSKDDFVKALYLLENNFCNERIEDVKKIGRTLYPIQKHTSKGESQPKKAIHHQNKKSMLPIIMLGILVVGILLIWVGLLSK